MTAEQIASFRGIVAEHLGVNLARVIDAADFIHDLGADSLDIFEIALATEEEFDIEVDYDMDGTPTVGDALTYLRGRLS